MAKTWLTASQFNFKSVFVLESKGMQGEVLTRWGNPNIDVDRKNIRVNRFIYHLINVQRPMLV